VKNVLVIGDAMIDRYHYVSTERSAQEADIPVCDLLESEDRLGGATNVAANIKSLDADILVTFTGIADGCLRSLLLKDGIEPVCAYGEPIIKTRIVNCGTIIARVDNKKRFSTQRSNLLEELCDKVDFNRFDVIVISDYDKGTLSDSLIRKLVSSKAITIVDSKRYDLSPYKGTNFLNINEIEYSAQASSKEYLCVESLFDNVIVTRGKKPTLLLQHEPTGNSSSYITHREEFPIDAVSEVDVTGCGDTHTAAFVAGLLRDMLDIRNAVRYANQCASIAVTKQGTTKVTKWDFLKNLEDS